MAGVEWPFVGRVDELEAITQTRRAGAHAVVLAGPAGIGKTRLAREVAAQAGTDGWAVEWAVGTASARDLPLGAFLHLVPDGRGARGEALLGAIVDGLVAHEADRQLLLVVDDAHLLDPASATLVHRLALTERAFIVATMRAGEPVADAIRLLWRDDAGRMLEVEPFDEKGAALLAASLLGGPVDAATAQSMWTTTRGNALFLRELVDEGVRRGSLRRDGDRWTWRGPPVVSAGLRDFVATRVDGLDAAARAALEVVAICEPIGSQLLEQLVDADALALLEQERMIELSAEGSRRNLRSGHPLVGEAVRLQVPPTRANAIRRAFADALTATGARRAEDVLRLAQLHLDTGDDSDTELLTRAARQAWALGNLTWQVRLAAAAARRGPNAEAEYLLGEAMADQGRFEEALVHWEPLGDADADDEITVQIAKGRATVLANVFNRPDDAIAVIEKALGRITDRDGRVVLEILRDDLARRWETRDMATAPTNESAVWIWIANGRTAIMAGRFDEVADDPTPVEDMARASSGEWPLALLFVRVIRFFANHCAGRFDVCEAIARDGLTNAIGNERLAIRAYWLEGLGLTALGRGHPQEAAAHLTDAVNALREANNGALRNALYELTMARAQAGDEAGAAAALEEAEDAQGGIIEPFVSEARARAAFEAGRGHTRAAAELVAADAKRAQAEDFSLFELHARFDGARYGAAREHAERLRTLATLMPHPVPGLYARFATALAGEDAEELAATGRAFAEIGAILHAAEATAAAARAARGRGLASALAWAERAAELAAAAGNPYTPLLAGGVETAVLTPREREVAGLVAQGHSDKDVAAALGLSVRTVNAHLRSVYVKLRVSGRDELAIALGS